MLFFASGSQIQDVLKESAISALNEVTQPLENALAFLRREAPARYLVPSVEHIVISQVTATALFDALWNLDGAKAPDIARAIGENAGVRFSDSLWDWLVAIGRAPADVTALLELWTTIDSSANWGTMAFSKLDEGRFAVYVTNSFLTRATNSSHDFCAFMEGYIFGFAWNSLKEMHHWTNADRRSPSNSGIAAVIRTCGANRCSFEIQTEEDRLSRAYDEFMIARQQMRTQPELIDAQVAPLRRSLEAGFKAKLDLAPADRWEHTVRAAREVLNYAQFLKPLKDAQRVHTELSGQTHDNREALLSPDRVRELAWEVSAVLRFLEYARIPNEKIAEIRAVVENRQAGKRPNAS